MMDRNDRNGRNDRNDIFHRMNVSSSPCTVVITPQIEILKRYINYWKMWTSIMFALFLLTFYCVDKFMIYNEVAFNIYYFALLFFITGFFITYIIYHNRHHRHYKKKNIPNLLSIQRTHKFKMGCVTFLL